MSKKLKQACLPFKILGAKPESALKSDSPVQSRKKRKNSEDQCKINLKISKPDVIVVDDDETDCEIISEEKSDAEVAIKLSAPAGDAAEEPSSNVESSVQEDSNDKVSSHTSLDNDGDESGDEEKELSLCSQSDENDTPSTSQIQSEDTTPKKELEQNNTEIAMVTPTGSADSSAAGTPKTPKTNKRLKLSEEGKRKQLEEKQKRHQEKLEASLKKQQAKEEKLKEKEEKLKQRQLLNEAKREEKRKKDEERKVKEDSKRQRDEERKKKDEDKRRKDEERRNREEEKKKADEEISKKKEKEKRAFVNFFVKKDVGNTSENGQPETRQYFLPFPVKENMKIAPVCRISAEKRESLKPNLDELVATQNVSACYLDELKNHLVTPGKSCKTFLDTDPDVEIISSDIVEDGKPAKSYKAKLFQFCENTRPPYWGTWQKRSKIINPRKPWRKDDGFFDYDVDSDDEWEEEEAGESLEKTDDEKESEDEYEVDNDVFVPHGYLSEEEAQNEDDVVESADAMKVKLRIMEQEFQKEMKKQCKKLHPKVLGCFWDNDDKPGIEDVKRVLAEYTAIPLVTVPIEIKPSGKHNDSVGTEVSPNKTKNDNSGAKCVPDEAMPYLIRMLHGNTNGKERLSPEFMEFWKNHFPKLNASSAKISKRQLNLTIQQIATWCKCPNAGPMFGKFCYYVKDDVRAKFELGQLELPNTWNFAVSPNVKQKTITSLLGVNVEKLASEQTTNEVSSVAVISSPTSECELLA